MMLFLGDILFLFYYKDAMKNAIIKHDRNFIWHPFTQHGTERDFIPIASAHNASLVTYDGQEILDCISSWWTITHAHNHPILNEALVKQSETLSHVMFAGFTHKPAVSLGVDLIASTHGAFDKVFFADNGSTAVEVALKMVYHYHYNHGHPDKTLFLAFDGAYHGDTFGAMATGRTTGFYKPFEPFLCDVKFLPYPDTYDGDNNIHQKEHTALIALEEVLNRYHDKIACMIIEPLLQGAGGMRLCRPAFLKKYCEILHKAGVKIIFDEVATGFGRLGSLFAFQKLDFIPDFICLSKGLTGGYMPLAVTMTKNEIYNAFLGDNFSKAFTHGHSFTANPLACAVAGASLGLFETEQTLTKIQTINDIYQEYLPILQNCPIIEKCRMMGSVLAWDVKTSDNAYGSAFGETLKNNFLQKGLNMRGLGNSFYLLPPYCITKEEMKRIFISIKDVFEGK